MLTTRLWRPLRPRRLPPPSNRHRIKLTEQKCSVSFPCFCGGFLTRRHPLFPVFRQPVFRWVFPPKIKYSSGEISTCEQMVENPRKPHKIKGLRRFFSGKDRGKCERFTPFFPTFRVGLGSLSPNFPFSGVKLRWKSGRFGGKPIKWGSFPQKVANRDFLLLFMQNFYKNTPVLQSKITRILSFDDRRIPTIAQTIQSVQTSSTPNS